MRVALRLVEAAEEAELPSLRAGIALGPALLRAGDYYGHSVNIASRVTGIARPGSVLCTEEVRDAAGDDGLSGQRRGVTGSRAFEPRCPCTARGSAIQAPTAAAKPSPPPAREAPRR